MFIMIINIRQDGGCVARLHDYWGATQAAMHAIWCNVCNHEMNLHNVSSGDLALRIAPASPHSPSPITRLRCATGGILNPRRKKADALPSPAALGANLLSKSHRFSETAFGE
jgi:hypothetical protein